MCRHAGFRWGVRRGGNSLAAREGSAAVRSGELFCSAGSVLLVCSVYSPFLYHCCCRSVKLPLSQPTSFCLFSFYSPPHPGGGRGGRMVLLLPAAAETRTVVQDRLKLVLEYLHRWRLHRLSGQPIPVFDQPYSKKGVFLSFHQHFNSFFIKGKLHIENNFLIKKKAQKIKTEIYKLRSMSALSWYRIQQFWDWKYFGTSWIQFFCFLSTLIQLFHKPEPSPLGDLLLLCLYTEFIVSSALQVRLIKVSLLFISLLLNQGRPTSCKNIKILYTSFRAHSMQSSWFSSQGPIIKYEGKWHFFTALHL